MNDQVTGYVTFITDPGIGYRSSALQHGLLQAFEAEEGKPWSFPPEKQEQE